MTTAAPLRIGLVPGGGFCLVLNPAAPQSAHVEFDAQAQPGSDERSRLGAALTRHTTLRQGDDELHVCVGDNVVARVHAGVMTEHRPLTAFAARFLAENGMPLANGPLQGIATATTADGESGRLQTDLHSHFAGCLSGRDLVDLGLTVDAAIPQTVLAQAGIFCERDTPLSALAPAARDRLACALDIPLDRQVTFLDMERLYAMRAPLTRHPALFAPQLWRIAQRAAEAPVRYLELSLSSILEPALLAQAHATLPAIEAQWGVGIRFLVALSRHDDLEWDLDVLRRAQACLGSRAIVGIDFMGHETNSTMGATYATPPWSPKPTRRAPSSCPCRAGHSAWRLTMTSCWPWCWALLQSTDRASSVGPDNFCKASNTSAHAGMSGSISAKCPTPGNTTSRVAGKALQ